MIKNRTNKEKFEFVENRVYIFRNQKLGFVLATMLIETDTFHIKNFRPFVM